MEDPDLLIMELLLEIWDYHWKEEELKSQDKHLVVLMQNKELSVSPLPKQKQPSNTNNSINGAKQ